MTKRLDRQQFLGEDSDHVLARSTAAIIGLGGGGSHIAQQLAHLGHGRFLLFDADRIEDTNLNRLVGATERDVRLGALKVDVAERVIKGVNGNAEVRKYPLRWQEDHSPLRKCTIVFGCVDRFDERRQLEAYCRRFLIPYIDIGMDIHKLTDRYAVAGQVILSMPGEPCMQCLGFLREDDDEPAYGAAGSKPQVVWPNGLLASLAVGLYVGLITPWQPNHRRVEYLEYDGNAQEVRPGIALQFAPSVCPHYAPDAVGDPFYS